MNRAPLGLLDIRPVKLAGEHVLLEPLSEEHYEGLVDVGLDPELWRWTVTLIRSPSDMRTYVEEALRLRDQGYAVPFAIRDRASGRVIGSTRFGNIDRANRRVEIGWTWIAREWQRTAANTESKYLMLRHAFDELGCIRVEFKTDLLNQASRRALERIGAAHEGVLRKHVVTATGRVRDTVYYSVIQEEWPQVRSALEQKLGRAETH